MKCININKNIKCECGGVGELYNIFLKNKETLGLQYECNYFCENELNKYTKLELEKEIECECGDTAKLFNVRLNKTSDINAKLCLTYICSHHCDSIIYKNIELKLV